MLHCRTQQGFTLIELVMIIVVLGIIAAVAIPKMGNMTESSKISATKAEMMMLKKAIVGNPQAVAGGRFVDVGFEGDVGHPPVSLSELGAKPDTVAAYNKFTRLGWNGPYVDTSGSEYLTDAWGTGYVYDASGRRLVSIGGADSIVVSF
ncbi:MAG: prepilin-type N-terminal cleavage/methylation domain-containing protein [Candidatus Zixiibacteriota bacterium]